MSPAGSLPRILNAYVQVNLVKGFTYIDLVGRILNALSDGYPIRSVTMDGMRLISQEAKVQEIRVSSEQIWLHFPQPEGLDFVVTESRRIIHIIADILGVSVFNRVALRAEFLVPLSSPREQILLLEKRIFSDAMSGYVESGYSQEPDDELDRVGFELTLPRTDGELNIRLRLATVRYSEDQETGQEKASDLPKFGIIIDPDVASTALVNRNAARGILRAAVGWMRDNVPEVVQLLGTEERADVDNRIA